MDINEFSIACKLINLKLRGFEIPTTLPPILVNSVKNTPPAIPPLPVMAPVRGVVPPRPPGSTPPLGQQPMIPPIMPPQPMVQPIIPPMSQPIIPPMSQPIIPPIVQPIVPPMMQQTIVIQPMAQSAMPSLGAQPLIPGINDSPLIPFESKESPLLSEAPKPAGNFEPVASSTPNRPLERVGSLESPA